MPRICAICDNTNATTYICRKCKKDLANQDWYEGSEVPTDKIDDMVSPSRMIDMWERPYRRPNELYRQIVLLLARDDIPRPRRVRARRNGQLCYVTKMIPGELSMREIARRLGCQESYVRHVLAHATGTLEK